MCPYKCTLTSTYLTNKVTQDTSKPNYCRNNACRKIGCLLSHYPDDKICIMYHINKMIAVSLFEKKSTFGDEKNVVKDPFFRQEIFW